MPRVRITALRPTAFLVAFLSFLAPGSVQESQGRAGDPKAVEFKSTDGVPLKGFLFGAGPVGVILTHMLPADQTSWTPLAQGLAEKGYRVLTFDCRGFGESAGERVVSEIDRDLEGAYRFLRPDVERIFLVGAGTGATASWLVASRLPVTGVVSLSGPVAFQGLDAEQAVKEIRSPLLCLASEGDVNAVMAARWIEHLQTSNRKLLIFPGAEHGTRLLRAAPGKQVEEVILRFLKDH
jgi:pimeloyl-ACP methyl ester carboxylesterase